MKENKPMNRGYMALGGSIYVIAVAVIVIASWVSGIHRFDFSLTVSMYIGLQRWTSVMYFICIVAMNLLMVMYIWKNHFHFIKKIVYCLVMTCILGCAIFPYNDIALTSTIHNYFSYALMLFTTASFVILLTQAVNVRQRILAVLGILFAVLFIIAYVTSFRVFRETIFIWENVFIFLLMIELFLETSRAHSE